MDVETNKPMQKDTIFRIYSMTKPIAAAAVMILCEKGKLQLDAPVSIYLPELGGLKVAKDPDAETLVVVESDSRDDRSRLNAAYSRTAGGCPIHGRANRR